MACEHGDRPSQQLLAPKESPAGLGLYFLALRAEMQPVGPEPRVCMEK